MKVTKRYLIIPVLLIFVGGLLQAAVQSPPRKFGSRGFSQLTQRPSQTLYQDWQLAVNKANIALNQLRTLVITRNDFNPGTGTIIIVNNSALGQALEKVEVALRDLQAAGKNIKKEYPNAVNEFRQIAKRGGMTLDELTKKIKKFFNIVGDHTSNLERLRLIKADFQNLSDDIDEEEERVG